MSRVLGMLLVVLALVSQLALGSVVLADDLDTASIFCESGSVPADAPSPQHHHADFCLVPLSATLALPAFLPSPGPLLPIPRGVLVIRPVAAAQARAPPDTVIAAAYPRGPPALV